MANKHPKTALMVIDVQEFLIGLNPYHAQDYLNQLETFIHQTREAGIEVIYVRHNDGNMKNGTPEWQVHHQIAPQNDEKIIDKTFASSFKDTDLKNYLDQQGIEQLLITGMQTEYCVDTTLRVAFEHGYKIIVPEGLTNTFDTETISAPTIRKHYETVWGNAFAQVVPVEAVLETIKGE